MTTAASSSDPPGLQWLDTILPPIGLVSMLGSLITFTVTVGGYGSPRHFWDALPTFIALAWLFFTLTLVLCVLVSMALVFHRAHIRDAFDRGYRGWRGTGRTAGERVVVFGVTVMGASLWLMLLVVLAFVFLSLVVACYSLAIGWIAFVVNVLLLIGTIVFWVLMNQK